MHITRERDLMKECRGGGWGAQRIPPSPATLCHPCPGAEQTRGGKETGPGTLGSPSPGRSSHW